MVTCRQSCPEPPSECQTSSQASSLSFSPRTPCPQSTWAGRNASHTHTNVQRTLPHSQIARLGQLGFSLITEKRVVQDLVVDFDPAALWLDTITGLALQLLFLVHFTRGFPQFRDTCCRYVLWQLKRWLFDAALALFPRKKPTITTNRTGSPKTQRVESTCRYRRFKHQ